MIIRLLNQDLATDSSAWHGRTQASPWQAGTLAAMWSRRDALFGQGTIESVADEGQGTQRLHALQGLRQGTCTS